MKLIWKMLAVVREEWGKLVRMARSQFGAHVTVIIMMKQGCRQVLLWQTACYYQLCRSKLPTRPIWSYNLSLCTKTYDCLDCEKIQHQYAVSLANRVTSVNVRISGVATGGLDGALHRGSQAQGDLGNWPTINSFHREEEPCWTLSNSVPFN